MDVNSAVQNGTDRKGRPMTTEQALFKFAGTALTFTPIKFSGAINSNLATKYLSSVNELAIFENVAGFRLHIGDV